MNRAPRRTALVLILALLSLLLLAGPAGAAEDEGGCGWANLGCKAGEAAAGLAIDALDNLADAIGEAVGTVIKSLGTVWVNIGTPSLTSGSAADWLRGQLAFYTGLMAVISVLIGAARLALERKAQPGKDLVRALLTLVAVNSVLVVSIAGLVAGGDAFAVYIIDQSTEGTDFGRNISMLLQLSALTGVGSIINILLGIGALIASIVQIVLMVARGGLLVLVTGLLPLSASFTNTVMGKHWFQKMLAWTIAALLYKPAAAVVYAIAFRLTGSKVFGDDGITGVLAGLLLMLMALLALPALMTLAAPAVSAAADRSSGSGGSMAAGAVAAGAQVIQLRSGGGTNGGGSTSGSASPSASPSGAQVSGAAGASGSAGSAGSAGAAGASSAGGAASAGAGAAAGGAAASGAAAAAGPIGAVATVGQAALSKAKDTAAGAADGSTGGQQ